jgi:tRNA U55 pseudouridine synthase TruB
LVRTAIGPFTLEGALALSRLEEAAHQGHWHRHVISLATAVEAFPAIVITATAVRALAHGIPPTRQGICRMLGTFAEGETVAILGQDGALLAMGSPSFASTELNAVPSSAPAVRLRRVLIEVGRPFNLADGTA